MPLTLEELVKKADDMTLTVREAVEYAMDRPTVSANAKTKINALISGFEKAGLDIDMPYAEMRHEDNWIKLSKEVGGANRYGNFQSLENAIRPQLQAAGMTNKQLSIEGSSAKIDVYPKIAGADGISKGTGRTGLAGTREMRGLIPQDAIEQMYGVAIPEVQKEFGDVAADAMTYHKATFQRPEQLFGKGGIKKSEVRIEGDEVIIGKITRVRKTRPEVSFSKDSEIGQLILRNLESSKTDYLFDISKEKYDTAYTKTMSPQLLGAFEDKLPLIDQKNPAKGVVSTPSATRHFMVKMLRDEHKVPDDILEGMMGHKDTKILATNYAGARVIEGMGEIINANAAGVPSSVATFTGVGAAGEPAIKLTEEQQFAIGEEKKASAELEALRANRERIEYLQSEEGQKFLQGQMDLEKQSIDKQVELEEYKRQKREEAKAIREAEGAPEPKPKMTEEGHKSAVQKLMEIFGKGGKKALSTLPIVGIPFAAAIKTEEAEAAIAEGAPALPTYAGKTAEFLAEEFTPYGAIDMATQLSGALGEVRPDDDEADVEGFTESEVGIIEEDKARREEEDKEKLRNFLELDLGPQP